MHAVYSPPVEKSNSKVEIRDIHEGMKPQFGDQNAHFLVSIRNLLTGCQFGKISEN